MWDPRIEFRSGLGGKCLYLLSHLASPSKAFTCRQWASTLTQILSGFQMPWWWRRWRRGLALDKAAWAGIWASTLDTNMIVSKKPGCPLPLVTCYWNDDKITSCLIRIVWGLNKSHCLAREKYQIKSNNPHCSYLPLCPDKLSQILCKTFNKKRKKLFHITLKCIYRIRNVELRQCLDSLLKNYTECSTVFLQ